VGSAIYKKKRRWHAKKVDKIQRGMFIYEQGRIKTVVLHDSEAASVLGKYLNNVKLMLTGSLDYVEFEKMYKYMSIRDAYGKWHKLETRLEAIKDIELAKEQIIFGDVYDY